MRSTAIAVDGAARRRRERRLRGHWKHECLSVRMAVAAATHHSSGKCDVTTAETAVQTAPSPVIEFMNAPAVSYAAPATANAYGAYAPPVTDATPAPAIESAGTPAAFYAAPAPVIDFVGEPVALYAKPALQ